MEECDTANTEENLASSLVLSRLDTEENLYMYLAVFDHAVSLVLLRHQEGIQRPVYYLRKKLVDTETRYFSLEKMALALVHATRKLSYYFQAHTMWVLTEYPLQSLLRRSDFTRMIAKWGTRFGMFDIRYKPYNSIKGLVLEDFVVEFNPELGVLVRICGWCI